MQAITKLQNLEFYKKYLQVKKTILDFLDKRGYLQVDAPLLSPALIPEACLEVFTTDYIFQGKKEQLYLTPSPELFLKRLLAAGLGNCYFLGKSFRNSDPSTSRHAFEFTMLEFYKTKSNYLQLADEVMLLVRTIAEKLYNQPEITYKGKLYRLDHWEKITVQSAFERFAGISAEELFNPELLKTRAAKKGYQIKDATYEELFSQIYTQEVEPKLGNNGRLTLIYDYPQQFAALAQLNPDGQTAQRFEFYLAGIELGDCYTELTNPEEIRQRFLIEDAKRQKDGKIKLGGNDESLFK